MKFKSFVAAMAPLVLWALLIPASAQHFVPVGGTPYGVTNIAAGGVAIWALDYWDGSIYRYYAPTGLFYQIPGALTQVAVGGGSRMQLDEVWGVNSSNQTYRFDNGTQSWVPVSVPSPLAGVAVGAGYSNCHPYEVWGTTSSLQVWRYNYCTAQFEQIQASLTAVFTGGGEVWGLNQYNNIFRFNPATLQFDFIPGNLSWMSVGAGGVWGMGGPTGSFVYEFNPATQSWDPTYGSHYTVAAGGDGIFAQDNFSCFYAQTSRLTPSTGTWTQVFSQPNQCGRTIAVGSGSGVWAEYDSGFFGIGTPMAYLTF